MKHRSKILTYSYWVASRESASIFVLLGIISQFAHVYFMTYQLSSLDGYWRILQAIVMSIFFSCGLAYFILGGVKEGDESSENLRRKKLILVFTWVEIFINLMYWGNHLLWTPYAEGAKIDWFSFATAIPFAVLIPILLKAYGFSINVYEPSIEEPEDTQEEPVRNEAQEQEIETLNNTISDLQAKFDTLANKVEKGAYKLKFTGDGTDKVIDVELSQKEEEKEVIKPSIERLPEVIETSPRIGENSVVDPLTPAQQFEGIEEALEAEGIVPDDSNREVYTINDSPLVEHVDYIENSPKTPTIDEDILQVFEDMKPPKLSLDEELNAEISKLNESPTN